MSSFEKWLTSHQKLFTSDKLAYTAMLSTTAIFVLGPLPAFLVTLSRDNGCGRALGVGSFVTAALAGTETNCIVFKETS